MWFCVKFDEERHNYFEENDHGIRVNFYADDELPLSFAGIFRSTKIFSLSNRDEKNLQIENVSTIDFICSLNPAGILNIIQTEFEEYLISSTFFSIGSSSVLLINWKEENLVLLKSKIDLQSSEFERWGIDAHDKVIPDLTQFECLNASSQILF